MFNLEAQIRHCFRVSVTVILVLSRPSLPGTTSMSLQLRRRLITYSAAFVLCGW